MAIFRYAIIIAECGYLASIFCKNIVLTYMEILYCVKSIRYVHFFCAGLCFDDNPRLFGHVSSIIKFTED